MIKSIDWTGRTLRIIDQTRLPDQLIYRELHTISDIFDAIRALQVRGAPALGIAAAYGVYLGVRDKKIKTVMAGIRQAESNAQYLMKARPTAVNVKWALTEILTRLSLDLPDPETLIAEILRIARQLHRDDQSRCQKIGQNGAFLIEDGMTILTHCNTGALATTGIGTALGIFYTARQQQKKIRVLVDETRPLLQGARLTMWDLERNHIPATLITDSMAAYAMIKEGVDLVLVGADRVAGNGDVANKIGTYNLAILANFHRIPFYIAAPLSTVDFNIGHGNDIPIEERDPGEVKNILGRLPITSDKADCWNPAFDVTPAHLISGIITEEGVVYPPFADKFKQLNHMMYQNQEEVNL